MRKTSVQWLSVDPATSLYVNVVPRFSFLTKPKKRGGSYRQVTGWHACRETFSNELKNTGKHWSGTTCVVDHNMVRIAVAYTASRKMEEATFAKRAKDDQKGIKESVRILNILEKYKGWPLTKVYSEDRSTYWTNRIAVYVITGSPKWLRSPHLLSMYLLIIRLGRFYKDLSGLKKIDGIKKVVNNFRRSKLQLGKKFPGSVDGRMMVDTHAYWKLILDNYEDLFCHRSMKDNYARSDIDEGVLKLIKGQALDKELTRKFELLVEESKK